MMELPTLDAHANISLNQNSKDLERAGVVLAMSLSLEEAELAWTAEATCKWNDNYEISGKSWKYIRKQPASPACTVSERVRRFWKNCNGALRRV